MLWLSGAPLSAPAEKRSENEIDRVAEEALGWAGLGWAGLGWAGLGWRPGGLVTFTVPSSSCRLPLSKPLTLHISTN